MELKALPKWIEMFEKHPFTKKIVEEDRAATDAKRSAALSEMTSLETAFLKEKAKVEAAIETAGEAVKAAAKALENARAAYGAANHKKILLNVEFDGLYRGQKAILLSTYAPEIEEFISEMLGKLAEIPKSFRVFEREGETHFFLPDEIACVSTNAEAIKQASDYIRKAIIEAEGMKVADLSGIDVTARLQELRAGIPKADIFSDAEPVKPDVSALDKGRLPRPKPRVEYVNGSWQPLGGW